MEIKHGLVQLCWLTVKQRFRQPLVCEAPCSGHHWCCTFSWGPSNGGQLWWAIKMLPVGRGLFCFICVEITNRQSVAPLVLTVLSFECQWLSAVGVSSCACCLEPAATGRPWEPFHPFPPAGVSDAEQFSIVFPLLVTLSITTPLLTTCGTTDC